MHSIFSSRVCIANSRFSGLRYRYIPSLRFGTGFASPYNPCHSLNSKANLQKQKKTFSQFSVNILQCALISFILLMFCSCQKKTVTLKNTDFIPQSIISLSPASTEILFAVGAQNQIVAVSDLSDYPPETKSLPKVGGFDGKTLSLETILSFKPDFVYLTDGMHNFLIEQLEQNNIKYYISSSSSINDIFSEMMEIGKITGHQAEAENKVASLQNQLQEITDSSSVNSSANADSTAKQKTVYYEVWNAPYMSCGSSSFINDIIEKAGGKNIFANLQDAYPIVSEETILAENPDIILIPQSSGISIDSIKSRNGWNKMQAVQKNQIYLVDDNLLSRPGPRAINAVQNLSKILNTQ